MNRTFAIAIVIFVSIAASGCSKKKPENLPPAPGVTQNDRGSPVILPGSQLNISNRYLRFALPAQGLKITVTLGIAMFDTTDEYAEISATLFVLPIRMDKILAVFAGCKNIGLLIVNARFNLHQSKNR